MPDEIWSDVQAGIKSDGSNLYVGDLQARARLEKRTRDLRVFQLEEALEKSMTEHDPDWRSLCSCAKSGDKDCWYCQTKALLGQ